MQVEYNRAAPGQPSDQPKAQSLKPRRVVNIAKLHRSGHNRLLIFGQVKRAGPGAASSGLGGTNPNAAADLSRPEGP
jgi:hypothetical protein